MQTMKLGNPVPKDTAMVKYLSYKVYQANKGSEYLQKIATEVQLSTFDYYYNRMKKMTLLREYDKVGLDLKWLYDPDNILDSKKNNQSLNVFLGATFQTAATSFSLGFIIIFSLCSCKISLILIVLLFLCFLQ